MSPASSPDPAQRSPSADVPELVAQCLEAIERDGEQAIETFCGAHAEHAEVIRARLRLLRDAGLLRQLAPAEADGFPETLGDFRLKRRLGSGGMGVVYLADQESLRREVALKLIRSDSRYFPGARERFQREAKAVAQLAHPGIVPVFLTGEASGIPFIAMERVAGASLADVLLQVEGSEPRTLDAAVFEAAVLRATRSNGWEVQDGLQGAFGPSWVVACCRVVRAVAEALAHAHSHGVLHRDLKPSNIMLTPDGRVLLLDFGLASMEGGDRITRTGSQAGSLPYMAPEQLDGDRATVSVRTDVYALGVTLYELLVLRGPFGAATQSQIRNRVLEGTVPALRSLNPTLPQDAETICLTAMARDPERRYPSAAALAQDLANFLELRPIVAERPGPWQRLRLWVRRHPARATSAALAALLLLGAPTALAVQQHLDNERIKAALTEATTQRTSAEGSFRQAMKAVESLLIEVGQHTLQEVPQMDRVRVRLLSKAMGFYDAFLRERGNDPRLLAGAARTVNRLGNIQTGLGDLADAERSLRRAVDLETALIQADPGEARHRSDLGDFHFSLGKLYRGQTRMGDAISEFTTAEGLYREALAANPGDYAPASGLSKAEIGLGALHAEMEHLAEAEAAFERGRDLLIDLVARFPGRDEPRLDLPLAWQNLGNVYQSTQRFDAAEAAYRSAIAAHEALPAQIFASRADRASRAFLWRNLGSMLELQERLAEAAVAMQKTIDLLDQLVAEHPDEQRSASELGLVHIGMGEIRERSGTMDAAEREYRLAESRLGALNAAHPTPENAINHGTALTSLGQFLARDRAGEAEGLLRQALALEGQAVADQPSVAMYHQRVAVAARELARIIRQHGSEDEARLLLERAKAETRTASGLRR